MLRTDSRKVRPGDTFIALEGISSNGTDYIEDALANGASEIVCTDASYAEKISKVHITVVPDARAYLEEELVRRYGDIISGMKLIGVTGTNGKTTTCFLIAQALNALDIRCAYIGTIGFYLSEKVCDLPNTSIDICDLYELLLDAHESGFDTVVMEASSQGLDMGRLHTLTFDTAVFTNLTEDHLDYHKTMLRYAMAKKILFDSLKNGGMAVVNVDDSAKDIFLKDPAHTLTYGLADSGDDPDIAIQSFYFEGNNTTCRIVCKGNEYTFRTHLTGEYNMYNLAAMIGVLLTFYVSADRIIGVIPELLPPEGRMDRIAYKGSDIIIDYAHTPDAFEKIFAAARSISNGNIYTVFGCTGDREREKRPVMTRLALEASRMCVITVDDIHGEDPEQIFADMLSGNEMDNYLICPDRREAIKKGMLMLETGDVLLILGKGHEQFIACDSGNIRHNDRQAVLEIAAEES